MFSMIHSSFTENASPEWKSLYEAAVRETDQSKLLERIACARKAILDRVEESIPNRVFAEQRELDAALRTLRTLSNK